MSIFHHIFTDIGDNQSIENELVLILSFVTNEQF